MYCSKNEIKNKTPPKDIDQQYIQRQVKTLETIGIIEKTEQSKGIHMLSKIPS